MNDTLSTLRREIRSLDAGKFQEFGDELLYRILYPNRIESRGSVLDKPKTKKGSPDSIFYVDECYNLIEYTTTSSSEKSKFVKKLESDIKSCLDVKKTEISTLQVSKIILFSNQRISETIKMELNRKFADRLGSCKIDYWDIDRIALVVQDFPSLLYRYLGLSFHSDCIIELQEFTLRSTNDKLKYKTPLDNKFLSRTEELNKGLNSLMENDILIVSGKAGIGKTKFALELLREFCNKNPFKAYAIQEQGSSLREILRDLDRNRNYIFLIDDVNRTGYWKELTELIRQNLHDNIKFVVTIRDYAEESLYRFATNLKFESIQLETNKGNLISDILTEQGILNSNCREHIISLSKGNLRIAMMCAQIALRDNNTTNLNSVEELYDAYFKESYEALADKEDGQILIKSLAIIAFFKVIVAEKSNLTDKITETFGIDIDTFKSASLTLRSSESVNISDDNIISMADQSYSNYVFYRCFFIDKILSLSDCIREFFSYPSNMTDALYSVMLCFSDARLQIIDDVKEAWKGLRNKETDIKMLLDFLSIFSTLMPYETFVYLKQSLGKTKAYQETVLNILTDFHQEDDQVASTAYDLIILYINNTPELLNKAISMFKSKWVSDKEDSRNRYSWQSFFIPLLIEKAQGGNLEYKLCCSLIGEFLHIIYHSSKTSGRNFIQCRYSLSLCEELTSNRAMAWNWIIDNHKNIDLVDFISHLYTDVNEAPEVGCDVIKSEKSHLLRLLNEIDLSSDYNLCVNTNYLLNRLKHLKITFEFDPAKLNNELYLLDNYLNRDVEQEVRYKFEKEGINIHSLVLSLQLDEVYLLIDKIIELGELKANGNPDERVSQVIETLIEQDDASALKVWMYSIQKGHIGMPGRVISKYITTNHPAESLYTFFQSIENDVRFSLILDLYTYVINAHKENFISDEIVAKAILHSPSIEHYTLETILNSWKEQEVRLRKIMAALLWRKRSNQCVENTENFLIAFLKSYPKKRGLIEDVYIYAKQDRKSRGVFGFDHDETLLKLILSMDSFFWIECCESIKGFSDINHVRPYKYIWTLDNYYSIIEKTIAFYSMKKPLSFISEDNIEAFFYNTKDNKPVELLDKIIATYSCNKDIMHVVFCLIANMYRNNGIHYYVTFLRHNTDVEAFKHLSFQQSILSGGNSFAPAYENIIEKLEAIKKAILDLGSIDYLSHIEFIDNKISQNKIIYQRELKKDHYYNLYDEVN